MRIAITTPTTWPYVTRGGERFVNELAAFLASRGHDVTVLAGSPERGVRKTQRGYVTRYHRRWWHPSLGKVGIVEAHAFMASCLPRLLTGRYDVVQCTTFLDTYAATVARRVTGTPCAFWVNSIPTDVKYIRSISVGGGVFRRAVRDVDEIVSLSEYVWRYLDHRFGRGGIVLPVPVDTDRFQPVECTWRPEIVCAAQLDDQRKGGSVLMAAFNGVKRVWPDATLNLVGGASDNTRSALLSVIAPEWRQDVTFCKCASDEVRQAFGRGAISVLPSLWESFGMVVLESMACGTPVVGTRHGALPELIPDSVGRLFDPGALAGASPTNVAGLTTAMLEAMELSRNPNTRQLCRDHAEQFSWSVVGPKFEQLYERLTAGSAVGHSARRFA
jgi:phosphatidylinositol alpha-mannosyltransferase